MMPPTSRLPRPTSRPDPSASERETAPNTPTRRGRSNSFASALKRLLPINRPERGGTLRTHGIYSSSTLAPPFLPTSKSGPSISHSSPHELPAPDKLVRCNTAVDPISSPRTTTTGGVSPGTRSQQIYLDRREKRRQRRSLKESGDYLGAQGVHPATGEMDVDTPSTSTGSSSSPFVALARVMQDKRAAYEDARRAWRAERVRKWQLDKEVLTVERRRKVRWTRRAEGWSSAVEPDLSPITGSPGGCSTPRAVEMSGDTVLRGRSTGGTGTTEESVSTVRPGRRLSRSSTAGEFGIPRKPVPIRRRTLSSHVRSYSDLIPVDSEISPTPPPIPPKIALDSVG